MSDKNRNGHRSNNYDDQNTRTTYIPHEVKEQYRPEGQPQYREQPRQGYYEGQPQYREQPHQGYYEGQPQYREQPRQEYYEGQPQYREQPRQRYYEGQPQYREQPRQGYYEGQPQYREQPRQGYYEVSSHVSKGAMLSRKIVSAVLHLLRRSVSHARKKAAQE